MTTNHKESEKKYISAFNSILDKIANNVNSSITENTLHAFLDDGPFSGVFTIKDNKIIALKLNCDESIKIFYWQLLSDLNDDEKQQVRSLTLATFSSYNIETEKLILDSIDGHTQKGLLENNLPSESDVDDAFDRLLD